MTGASVALIPGSNTNTLLSLTCPGHTPPLPHIECCNTLHMELPLKSAWKPPLVQTSAAQAVMCTIKPVPVTPRLPKLYWLPVCFQVQFTMLMMPNKVLGGMLPHHLKNLFFPVRSMHPIGWACCESHRPRNVIQWHPLHLPFGISATPKPSFALWPGGRRVTVWSL